MHSHDKVLKEYRIIPSKCKLGSGNLERAWAPCLLFLFLKQSRYNLLGKSENKLLRVGGAPFGALLCLRARGTMVGRPVCCHHIGDLKGLNANWASAYAEKKSYLTWI